MREAWGEAGLKHYAPLCVIGFAIDPKARQFIDSAAKIGLPATYLQATMDLQMGDLLRNMRSIANAFIPERLRKVCGAAGFELPVICTPQGLLGTSPKYENES